MGTFVVTGSDPGAAQRLADTASVFTPDYGSTSTSSTVVGPERLVARTDRDIARSVLGNPLSAVIGTGRVNGSYFIGGNSQTDTRTTLTTTTTVPPEGFFVVVNSNPDAASRLAGWASLFTQKEITTETNVTTTITTKAGYVLAYDYFERGYDLIRLEVNGQIVFDTENALSPIVEFRFYGGRQTSVDPIVDDIIGTLPGAYENMVMVFIDGFPAESPPSISAVISNAATDQLEDVRIEWTGALPVNLYQISAGRNTAYDPGRGTMYQVFTDLEGASGAMKLVVLDIATHTELYRVTLEGTDATYSAFVHPIRGTDFVIVRTAEPSLPRIDGIYDVLTGELVAAYDEGSESAATLAANPALNNFSWIAGEAFQGKWLMVGNNLAGSSTEYVPIGGVFDYAGETIEVTRIPGMPVIGSSAFCYGRVSDSSASFFQLHGTELGLSFPIIREISYDGTTWSSRDVYEHNIVIESFWYDPGTGYLVLSTFLNDSPFTPILQYVDPDDGSVIRTIIVTQAFNIPQDQVSTGLERFFPRSGYVLLGDSLDPTDPGGVFQLNVASGAITAFAPASSSEYFTGIYDQVHGYYITGYNDQWWTIHYLPNQIPGLIDLSDAVTDIMSMAGFGAGDLTFSGFGGLSTYGFVINADTNIQSAVSTVADIYDFYWCDTGSGFYFKKPATDLTLTIDATFSTDDIIEKDDPVVSSDEGDIRTPSTVELEYISKEGGYIARPASFSMTTGVLNSITTPRLSTPILFNDAEAQRLVTEKFFQFQEHRRTHAFSVVPENITLLPGDIISVPSGEVAYIAAIEAIGIDLRTMGVEINARDFQTEVATTITATSNDPGAIVLLRFDTLYIHLDIPLLFYSHELNGTGLVQYGLLVPRLATWTGANLYRGVTPTVMSLLFDQPIHHSILAVAQDALGTPADPFGTTDNSTVTILPIVGDTDLLQDETEDAVLNHDANLALIGTNGRWELVGFTTVLDNGDGTWTLSGFVRRGFRGSEVWADNHTAGDYFIFPLTPVKRVEHVTSDLGDTYYYKAVGFGQDPINVAAFPHTIPGVAETPYAVRNIGATNDSPPSSPPAGINISWDYRSRVAEGLNPADHGEQTLAFEIDIIDTGTSPETVLRTLTSTTNSVNYSNAQVLADWGSYPDTLTVVVYMMSELDVVVPGQTPVVPGRGYASRTNILFDAGDFTFDSEVITFDSETISWDSA